MPKKPEKWGIKIWCLADSSSKFVYNFDVYCGKNHAVVDDEQPHRGESNLAFEVVTKLLDGLHDVGHVVVMDNYFTSIGLFRYLLSKGIYATGTIRVNRVGLPAKMKDTKSFDKQAQGSVDWQMHEDRGISCIIWKDKRPVLIISSHALPIALPC